MPLRIDWYIPYRVMDESMWGTLSSDDLEAHTQMTLKMLKDAEVNASGQQVFLLLDMIEVETMPPIYLMISQAMPVIRCKNRGLMILITQSKATRSIMELAAHVMHFQLQVVATREAALKALNLALVRDEQTQTVSRMND